MRVKIRYCAKRSPEEIALCSLAEDTMLRWYGGYLFCVLSEPSRLRLHHPPRRIHEVCYAEYPQYTPTFPMPNDYASVADFVPIYKVPPFLYPHFDAILKEIRRKRRLEEI